MWPFLIPLVTHINGQLYFNYLQLTALGWKGDAPLHFYRSPPMLACTASFITFLSLSVYFGRRKKHDFWDSSKQSSASSLCHVWFCFYLKTGLTFSGIQAPNYILTRYCPVKNHLSILPWSKRPLSIVQMYYSQQIVFESSFALSKGWTSHIFSQVICSYAMLERYTGARAPDCDFHHKP